MATRGKTGKPADAPIAVVGIVSSAGGVQALQRLFLNMPADSGMAFVVVPHLDPQRESMMPSLLARHTAIPVAEAGEGARLAANHVYVIPSNSNLALRDGTLRLLAPDPATSRTPIDPFLRSLAEDQGERAICIVLSGTGSCGTLGLTAVKESGGMAIAQDPHTAGDAQMPQSAIATGLADYVLPPEEMPPALGAYARRFLEATLAELEPQAEPTVMAPLLSLLQVRTGFDFRAYRKPTLLRRTQRRMGLRHVTRLADYLLLLRNDPSEVEGLARDLLISVTRFFRDREMFQVLETHAVQELVRQAPPDTPLRAWVVGCATGEEAYSIAIVLLEQIAAAGLARGVQVFATDVDQDALDVARRGRYPDGISADVSPERLRRFFTRVGPGGWQVTSELRETVLFSPQNALQDAPFSRLDLVSCRNVLIYLEPEMRQKLLSVLHFALNERGYLVLGTAESVAGREAMFDVVSRKWRVYRSSGAPRRPQVDFSINRRQASGLVGGRPAAPPTAQSSLAGIMRDVLATQFAPAAVVVDREHQVRQYCGPTHLYLCQPRGASTQDLLKLVPSGLRARLRGALERARHNNARVTVGATLLNRSGTRAALRVSAQPLPQPKAQGAQALMLVVFEDLPRARRAGAPPRDEPLLHELDRELSSSQAELKSTVEELEGANDELKAANEALRSGNDELETSKEELQSLYEELASTNSQLADKVAELEQVTSDMSNLLTSGALAVLYLGADRSIRRFTPAAARLLSISEGDVGRAIDAVAHRLSEPHLETDVDAVLQDLTPIARTVRVADNHWYLRQATPYRAADGRVDGVVITYAEVTALKRVEDVLREAAANLEARVAEGIAALGRAEASLRAEHELLEAVLETAPVVLIVRDAQGRVLRFNRFAEQLTGIDSAEILGKPLWEAMFEPEEAARAKEIFARTLAGQALPEEEVLSLQRDGSRRTLLWRAKRVEGRNGVPYVISIALDVTDQQTAESKARRRLDELAALYRVHTANELAATLSHELNQPLAAISSYSDACLQALKAGADSSDRVAANLEKIGAQALRAGRLINELRRFVAQGEMQRSAVDLNALVRSACMLVQPLAQRHNVRLLLGLAEGLPPVEAAEVQIEHVVTNLVRNAIESIAEAGMAAGEIWVGTRADPDGMACVTVTDSGPGLLDEKRERLFKPFFTTKASGLGMGLRVSRTLVEANGGRLWAEPGTVGAFSFTLRFAG